MAKVRSATATHFRSFGSAARATAITLVVVAIWPAAAQASAPAPAEPPRVIVVILPNGTEPAELAGVDGIAPGLLSAGLARVGAEQTYLDISQGNRVFTGFYDEPLPFLLPFRGRVPHWRQVVRRARSAPADIIPGLLATTLAGKRIAARTDPDLLTPSLIAVDEHGRFGQARGFCGIRSRCPSGMTLEAAYVRQLSALIANLQGDDMLIAIERAPPLAHHGLTIGIAGRGFRGNLLSDSTRLEGVVLSTDIAPTIVKRYGIDAPPEMLGRPIRAEGKADPDRLAQLNSRLSHIVQRRGAVIGTNILIWVIAAVGLAIAFRDRRARIPLALLGLACVYVPALLLVGAAFEPSLLVERIIVGLGASLLAALTLRFAPGYRAFAVACAVTVGAYALDMIAGSQLTPLSLIGPNPSLGVRFYGIGNELEAALSAMVVLGTGAALATLPGWSSRRQAATFATVAALATVIFAAGRFGADVGAAIVLPVGGATAALYVLGVRGRRLLALVVLAPIAGLAALFLLEAVAGGSSHISRSVLHANGAHDLAHVADRRLRSAAGSFTHPVNGLFLFLAVAGLIGAVAFRSRLRRWFEGRDPAFAGLLGALAATLVGALANDSGALILVIGTGVLTAYACFAWAQSPP